MKRSEATMTEEAKNITSQQPRAAQGDQSREAATVACPAVAYETLPWERDPEALAGISKTARQRIASTYQAAVPAHIAAYTPKLPSSLLERIGEVMYALAAFDAGQRNRGYNLPALLLRSESAASSRIENLTSSARNIALAEITTKVPKNAQIITGNVAAMRKALEVVEPLSTQAVLNVHAVLMGSTGAKHGGVLREERVWIGGCGFSPHGALFVPPAAERVPGLLQDAITFANRADLNAIAKAAITHAQFETVHPFIDGNGRTGRTLLHIMLRQDGILSHATLPVSAGLLHNIDAYMLAIKEYQAGNAAPIIYQVVEALDVAVALGNLVAGEVDALIDGWRARITERSNSAIYRLPDLLVDHPVVNTAVVSEHLGVSQRAALDMLSRACEYGIVREAGNYYRGSFYQADDLLDVLDRLSSISEIRRMLAHS